MLVGRGTYSLKLLRVKASYLSRNLTVRNCGENAVKKSADKNLILRRFNNVVPVNEVTNKTAQFSSQNGKF